MALSFRMFGRFMRLAMVIGLISAAGAVQAQDPQPPTAKAPAKPADPKAKALLGEVAKAYQALSSYSDQGEFAVAMTVGEKVQKQNVPLKLTFVRPNKLDLDAGPVRLLSDGKTLTTAVVPLKKYTAAAAPQKLSVDSFRDGPIGAMLFGGPSGVPMYLVVNLLTSPDPLKDVEKLGGSLQLDPADPKGNTLLIDQAEGPDLRLVIDAGSKLLSAVDLVIDPKQIEEAAKAGQVIKVDRLGWSAGTVATKVAADRSFAYQPPAGFSKVESFQQPGQPGEAVKPADEPEAADEKK